MSTPTPKELFTNSISELTELVERHDGLASKIGEYRTAAKASTKAETLPEDVVELTLPEPDPFTTWSEFLLSLNDYVETVNNAFVQAVNEKTALLQGSTKTERDELATVIATKTELAKALVTVLTTMGEDVSDTVIPSIKRKRSNATGSANAKNQRYYRRFSDGTVKYQSEQQNSFSSMAYYHSHPLSADGKRIPTSDFREILQGHGISNLVSEPWEFELPNGTILGMEIVQG